MLYYFELEDNKIICDDHHLQVLLMLQRKLFTSRDLKILLKTSSQLIWPQNFPHVGKKVFFATI